jgi:hypothetical protein
VISRLSARADKELALDANILLRAALGRRVLPLLERYVAGTVFSTTDVGVREATTLLPVVLLQRGEPALLVQRRADEMLQAVLPYVRNIELAGYQDFEAEARRRMRQRDETDWPSLALALALECPIWTEDRDFFGTGVATWASDLVEIYLQAAV